MFKRANDKILIIALAIVAVLGITFIVSGVNNTPEKTLHAYAKAVNKGDLDKANKYLISQDNDSLDELATYFYDMLISGGYEIKFIIDKVNYGDDEQTAQVKCFYKTTYQNEIDKGFGVVDMKKVNGKWLIDSDTL